MLGLLGLFFAMAIFRLILFAVTMFAVPPGLWLYPNLFEDVGFFDSFRPVWGWQEVSPLRYAAFNKISTDVMITGEEERKEEVKGIWIGKRRCYLGGNDWPTPSCLCHNICSSSNDYFDDPAKKFSP